MDATFFFFFHCQERYFYVYISYNQKDGKFKLSTSKTEQGFNVYTVVCQQSVLLVSGTGLVSILMLYQVSITRYTVSVCVGIVGVGYPI